MNLQTTNINLLLKEMCLHDLQLNIFLGMELIRQESTTKPMIKTQKLQQTSCTIRMEAISTSSFIKPPKSVHPKLNGYSDHNF